MTDSDRRKGKQGFASLTREKQREIAAIGGKSVPKEKRTFAKDTNLARTAGAKGGKATAANIRAFSTDRDLAAKAGRLGGKASRKKS